MADPRNAPACLLALLCSLGACAAPQKPVTATPAAVTSPVPASSERTTASAPATPAPGVTHPVPAETRPTFAAWLGRLREASCPPGTLPVQPAAIDLSVRPVTLDRLGAGREVVGVLHFAGGFHLSSSDARFGGLSGLAVREDGGLLAVTDAGAFVWIDLASDRLTPAAARLAPMRDAGGQGFAAKGDADAEGLALLDGLALVSFEQGHRVTAFDLAACGSAARAARLPGMEGAIASAFERSDVPATGNTGVEALAVSPDGVLFHGVEQLASGASPLSARVMEEPPAFDLALGPGSPQLTGLDAIEEADGRTVRLYSLHRAPALFGEAISLWETTLARWVESSGLPAKLADELTERAAVRYRKTGERKLAGMGALPFNIDNFEGVAARALPGGGVRLWVVSDDNYSASQRTLLLVFDVR